MTGRPRCQRHDREGQCPIRAVASFALPHRATLCAWHAYEALRRHPHHDEVVVHAIHDRREAAWLADAVPALHGLIEIVPGGAYL